MSCENRPYQPRNELYWQWPAFTQEKARGNVLCVRQENSTEYQASLDIPLLGQGNDFEFTRTNRTGEKNMDLSLRIPDKQLSSDHGNWQPITHGWTFHSSTNFRDMLTGLMKADRFNLPNLLYPLLEPNHRQCKNGHNQGRSYGFVAFKNKDTDEMMLLGLLPSTKEQEIINFEQEGNDLVISFSKNLEGLEKTEDHTFNFFAARGTEEDLWQAYNQRLQQWLKQKDMIKPEPEGKKIWFSWPSFGPHIDQKLLQTQIPYAKKLGIDIFMIDDGWQDTSHGLYGDWNIDRKKFDDLPKLIDQLNQAGIQPGIWIAPFRTTHSSKLYHDHPEWFASKPVSKMLLQHNPTLRKLKEPAYSLDISQAEVRQHLCAKFVELAQEGFEVFKVDFLNDIFLVDLKNKDKTTLEYYRQFWQEVRQTLKQKLGAEKADKISFIGCTAPVWESLGLFERMRGTEDSTIPWAALEKPKFYQDITYFVDNILPIIEKFVPLDLRSEVAKGFAAGYLSAEAAEAMVNRLDEKKVKFFIQAINDELYKEVLQVAAFRAKLLKGVVGFCLDGFHLAAPNDPAVLLSENVKENINRNILNLRQANPWMDIFIGDDLTQISIPLLKSILEIDNAGKIIS